MLLFFDDATGLLASLNGSVPYPCPEEVRARMTEAGKTAIDVPPFEPAYWHLVDGELRIRPRLSYTLDRKQEASGAILVTLSGLPAGVAVTIAGAMQAEAESDGEPVEIEFRQPGEYFISLKFAEYQPETLSVQVTGVEG